MILHMIACDAQISLESSDWIETLYGIHCILYNAAARAAYDHKLHLYTNVCEPYTVTLHCKAIDCLWNPKFGLQAIWRFVFINLVNKNRLPLKGRKIAISPIANWFND